MLRLNPVTVKRFRRFRNHRRSWYSLLLLLFLYLTSLGAELLCGGKPLLLWHNGRLRCPLLFFYPDNLFTGSGLNTAPDYKALAESEAFTQGSSWMLRPPLTTGPNDIVTAEELAPHLRISCRLEPVSIVCGISVDKDLRLLRFQGAELLDSDITDNWKEQQLDDFWHITPELITAIKMRFLNADSPAADFTCKGKNGLQDASISLAKYNSRTNPPKQVRLTLRSLRKNAQSFNWNFAKNDSVPLAEKDSFLKLPEETRKILTDALTASTADNTTQNGNLTIDDCPYSFFMEPEQVRFPFRPVKGHCLGLDNAGRDVLARLIYALRTSLNFGLILVICSMSIGSILGLLQGYAGGWVDLAGQRLIEIWSALPFLYVIILMGSIYGPGFWLMIFCYGLFNWISISYYMRAEMLRLRKQPFVEAARCLGLPAWRIILRHILPNGLIPIITFFPFSLVGAIGSLAALDYLGFGLPPPAPSIGQLLQQAQSQRWAWWLILYPSLTLFTVMILGVFVGEGVREAFDPRKQGRLE